MATIGEVDLETAMGNSIGITTQVMEVADPEGTPIEIPTAAIKTKIPTAPTTQTQTTTIETRLHRPENELLASKTPYPLSSLTASSSLNKKTNSCTRLPVLWEAKLNVFWTELRCWSLLWGVLTPPTE